MRLWRRMAAVAIVIPATVLTAVPAFGAGSGYEPTGSPPSSAIAGGFTSVTTTETLASVGGTVSGSADGSTCSVSIPSGAFPNGVQVVLSGAPPATINAGPAQSVVADCSVVMLDPNTGMELPGPFGQRVLVVVDANQISAKSVVLEISTPGVTHPAPNASTTAGQANVALTSNANLAVIAEGAATTPQPASTTPVSSPTSPSTPLAFTGVGPGYLVIALIGSSMLALALLFTTSWVVVRRRGRRNMSTRDSLWV